MTRGVPSPVLRAIAILVLAFAPAACDTTPPPKDPSSKIDPAEQAKIQKSRQKIDAAKDALDSKQYDQARKLLREATELGVESHKFEIEETGEKLDKRQAKLWANEAHELFTQKKCVEAFSQLSEQIDGLESETFTREIRKLTATEATECANTAIDELTTTGKFADARKLAASAPLKSVLGAPAQKKLSTELDLVIAEAIKGQVEPDIKAKKWAAALEKIDTAVKSGNATDEIATTAITAVREAAFSDIAAVASKAVGQGDASRTLAQIDQTIRQLRWETTAADGSPPAKEKAPPDELLHMRDALATWVEAQRLNIKMGKRGERRFIHGKVALLSPIKIDSPSRRDLTNATEVWVLGVSKDKALVADVDPKSTALSVMFDKAIGWVKLDRLQTDSTADWLPPDDQLKGEQVWGPLRTGETLLELGTVTDVVGKDISVKRLTDGQISKQARAKLRPGKIAVGVKLTGVCKEKGKEVAIDEIVPPGRSVRFHCQGTEGIKEEVLENLRTKTELLPKSK